MPTRKDLEKLKSLQEANNIIGELELDLAPGISKKFCRSKWDNRIIKTLLDEYIPLLRLAEERQSQEHWYVRGVRLSQDSNKGEDGEILFWGHRPSKVQVTRANMNHETELIREHMEAKKSRGYPLQECCGNPLQEEEIR